MNNDKYIGFKRLAAFVAAIGLWAVSMYFSYKGFEFDSSEILWFGVVLALVVTVVELVFNTKIGKLNPTLLGAGILCYAYGVYTNIVGFYALQHGVPEKFWLGSNWFIPVFSGVIAEVLPEALFAWAMKAASEGDLIGNIAEIFSSEQHAPKKNSFFETDTNESSISEMLHQKQGNKYKSSHHPKWDNR